MKPVEVKNASFVIKCTQMLMGKFNGKKKRRIDMALNGRAMVVECCVVGGELFGVIMGLAKFGGEL
ncbi:hypothetical protein ACOLXF_003586 [Vibrio fluvialis]